MLSFVNMYVSFKLAHFYHLLFNKHYIFKGELIWRISSCVVSFQLLWTQHILSFQNSFVMVQKPFKLTLGAVCSFHLFI